MFRPIAYSMAGIVAGYIAPFDLSGFPICVAIMEPQ